MSLPIFKHKSRAVRVEWNVFPIKRVSVFSRKARNAEMLNTQNVFIFWVMMIFVTQIGYSNFLIFAKMKTYIGVNASLPKAKYSVFPNDDREDIHIWMSMNYQVVINDFHIKDFSDLDSILINLTGGKRDKKILLYADKSVKMYYVQFVIDAISRIGPQDTYFMTDLGYF